MSIDKIIRKITKAWGGKTTGSGIADALNDLYNNIPFGTKTEMVEIVPEQSVTGGIDNPENPDASYISIFENPLPLSPESVIEVIFNGEIYKLDVIGVGDTAYYAGNGAIVEVSDNNTGEPFALASFEGTSMLLWNNSLGETITLAIYEEKEVVTKIDAKFVGGVTVYTHDSDGFLYHFDVETQTAGEKVSKEELAAAFNRGVIWVTNMTIDSIELNGYSSNEMVINVTLDPERNWGIVKWFDSVSTDGEYHIARTKEYVKPSGPPV